MLFLFRRKRRAKSSDSRPPVASPAPNCVPGARSVPEDASGAVADDSRPSARIGILPSLDSSNPAAENVQILWQQLCQYLQRCIEAEAASSLVPLVKKDEMWFLHCEDEKLVSGKSDVTPAPSALPGKLGSRTRSIIYGWPTVVIKDRDHAPKVAPLFVLPVEPERDRNNEWTLHATMEPEFNLAITASGLFDPSVAEDINDLLSHGLPFGDAEAFAALCRQTAELLGLPILSPLNAESLDTDLNRQQGVYNASISILAGWFGFTSTLLEELRQLQTRKDWTATAAAQLLLEQFAPNQVNRQPAGLLAAPLACNQSQEQTLERIRTQPLTVVTGPPEPARHSS